MKGYRENYNDRMYYEEVEVPKTDLGKWLGIEVECIIQDDYDRTTLTDYIIGDFIPACRVDGDGSIEYSEDDAEIDCEVAILTRIDDFSNLKKLLRAINKLSGRVNKSCGLHVHLDMRDVDELGRARACSFLEHSLPVLTKLVAPSRLDNQYCELGVGGKYSAINTHPLQHFGTIEVRLHQGSLDFKKITNWATLLHKIARSPAIDASSMKRLFKSVGLEPNIQEYFFKRAEHLARLRGTAYEPSELAA